MDEFESLYNNIEEYRSFREDSDKQKEYEIWADWKVKNLTSLVDKNLKFSNILEIGCAFGVILNKISSSLGINESYGLDIAKINTEYGKRLFPELVFITGTIDNTDLIKESGIKNQKFDLVVLCDIIEHIPEDLDFMKKVSTLSKYVLINLPLEKSLANRNRDYGINDISGHLRSYNLRDAYRLINDAGFKVINAKTEIIHRNEVCFSMFKMQRSQRISLKPFLKKIFWTFYYKFEDYILRNHKKLYIKLHGCNLFALIEPKEA